MYMYMQNSRGCVLFCAISLSLSLSPQLAAFGLSVLEDVDPNPANFVSAGVITTASVLVGCLLRLEPNTETKVQIHLVINAAYNNNCDHACINQPLGAKVEFPEPREIANAFTIITYIFKTL